jgi:hypothetical protein
MPMHGETVMRSWTPCENPRNIPEIHNWPAYFLKTGSHNQTQG